MSDTNEQSRPQGSNGGRRRKRRQGESPVWVDEEERRGKAAAMRGHPQPVSGRYQLFAEKMMGQQRVSLGDAKLLPGGEAEDAVGPLVPFDKDTQPMASIICCTVCGARPYPPSGFREDFDLMKLSSAGRPAEGDEGEWYCSRHFERRGALSFRIVKETDDANGSVKD